MDGGMFVEAVKSFTGMDGEQLRVTAAVLGIVGALALWSGRLWGWHKARSEIRKFRKGKDDAHIVIERLIFSTMTDNKVIFDRETEGGVHSLAEVMGSDHLADLIRTAIKKRRANGEVFPPGPLHRLMMERVEAYITGNDRAASQSAMFGRHNEYHRDQPVFTVRYMIGEDGFAMLHVILMNPDAFHLCCPSLYDSLLVFRRQVYRHRYAELLPVFVQDYSESRAAFEQYEDEDEAGEQARFWTTLIRTRKPALIKQA